jgi:hypothetical protein
LDDERRGHASRDPGIQTGAGTWSDPASVGDGRPIGRSEAQLAARVAAASTPDGRPGAGDLLSNLEGRSPYVTTCPFLRAALDDGTLDVPIELADYANRCAADGDAKPQSLRQQEMVCLTAAHADCPRYLRGIAAHARLAIPSDARRLSPPILASVVFLGVCAAASLGFVVARGGLEVPTVVQPTDAVAGATATPGPTLVAAPPSAQPSPSMPPPSPPPATPLPPAAPSVAPTARPTPPPTPEPTPVPRPTSDRYQYLTACPGTPDCYVYVIRYGDALFNLARYFGHPLETVYRLNPWARSGIHPGDQLLLPPPTR